MRNPRFLTTTLVSLLLSAAGSLPLAAQLPSLGNPPWLGYFAVVAGKHCNFSVSSQGKITLLPVDDKGQPVAKTLAIPVEITVEEILPDGKSTVKQIKPESLTSGQPATDKLEKTVIRGKVTGDAPFEITIEHLRGLISLGGRLLEPGTHAQNTLRFSIRLKFPSAYAKNQKGGNKDEKDEKKDARAFEKKISNDCIDLKWTDGKRKKQTFDKSVDASSKDLNGPGIAAAAIEIAAYKGNKFLITASENSSLVLSNAKSAPLHEGFAIHWRPDSAKDPAGKARISIEVK